MNKNSHPLDIDAGRINNTNNNNEIKGTLHLPRIIYNTTRYTGLSTASNKPARYNQPHRGTR
jgi:hypothetical protein